MSTLEELDKVAISVNMLQARVRKIREALEQEQRETASFMGAPVYMNKTQAAHYLGVNPRTIRRWENEGRIKFTNGRVHRRIVADVARGKHSKS